MGNGDRIWKYLIEVNHCVPSGWDNLWLEFFDMLVVGPCFGNCLLCCLFLLVCHLEIISRMICRIIAFVISIFSMLFFSFFHFLKFFSVLLSDFNFLQYKLPIRIRKAVLVQIQEFNQTVSANCSMRALSVYVFYYFL